MDDKQVTNELRKVGDRVDAGVEKVRGHVGKMAYVVMAVAVVAVIAGMLLHSHGG